MEGHGKGRSDKQVVCSVGGGSLQICVWTRNMIPLYGRPTNKRKGCQCHEISPEVFVSSSNLGSFKSYRKEYQLFTFRSPSQKLVLLFFISVIWREIMDTVQSFWDVLTNCSWL